MATRHARSEHLKFSEEIVIMPNDIVPAQKPQLTRIEPEMLYDELPPCKYRKRTTLNKEEKWADKPSAVIPDCINHGRILKLLVKGEIEVSDVRTEYYEKMGYYYIHINSNDCKTCGFRKEEGFFDAL